MYVFFNKTSVKIEGKLMGGSKPSLEGPYYLENAAVVTDRLPMRDEDQHHTAMQLRGRVTGMDGRPLARATIDVWHSTPEGRSEEHTSELQSLMRISYAVFCLKKKNKKHTQNITVHNIIN